MGGRGLRVRKKAETRQRIADVAAELFAERGYDAVSMVDVARAADVSDQTVYNYFAAKPDLVLDRAEQIRASYAEAVRGRGALTPPRAIEPMLRADIDRYAQADLDRARGEFLAQCVASPVLRRFALEERERQVRAVAEAIEATSGTLPPVVAHAHAAAVVAVVQVVHDQIGTSILDRAPRAATAEALHETARVALDSLDAGFADLVRHHG